MPYEPDPNNQGMRRRERSLGHQKGTLTTAGHGTPTPGEGSEGDFTLRKTAQGLTLFIKSDNRWYDVSTLGEDVWNTFVNNIYTRSSKQVGIGTAAPEGLLSIGAGMHVISIDQVIGAAHTGVNSVIIELPTFKIPAFAIIERVCAVVRIASNLSTHLVNIMMSATSGTAVNSTISSGTELLGAGVAATDSSDSTSAQDIDLKNDEKEVWISTTRVINGSSDQYIYVCNAVDNGATDPTEGLCHLTIIIEYFGMD